MRTFARVLAAGLGSDDARRALHRSLGVSPLFEHKLALPEFFSTPGGIVVLEAAAGATGRTLAEVQRLLSALPPMDLYVPYRKERLTWQATQSVAVAALLDLNSAVFAFTPTGDSIFYDRAARVPVSSTPTVLLGPREAYAKRPDVGQLVRTSARFIESEAEVTIAYQECWGDECAGEGGGGGGPPPPTDTLWGDTVVTHGICDNGNCSEGNEFQFDAFYPSGSGYMVRCEGVGSTQTIRMRFVCNGYTNKLHESAPNETSFVRIRVTETDGFSADDWFYAYQDPPDSVSTAAGASVKVTNNSFRRKAWVLYKVSYGAGCTPTCEQWVELLVKW